MKFGVWLAGLSCGAVLVTLHATERHIDLVVTDQAIGHAREVRLRDAIGFVQTAVAGFAGVGGVQLRAFIAGLG